MRKIFSIAIKTEKFSAAALAAAFLPHFLVHYFPMNHLNSPFAGNFLKDAIKSNYKPPKAFIDFLWFSATTFFTVGYGDIHPVGNIMYLLSTMEMKSAYILDMIMVPILLLKISNK